MSSQNSPKGFYGHPVWEPLYSWNLPTSFCTFSNTVLFFKINIQQDDLSTSCTNLILKTGRKKNSLLVPLDPHLLDIFKKKKKPSVSPHYTINNDNVIETEIINNNMTCNHEREKKNKKLVKNKNKSGGVTEGDDLQQWPVFNKRILLPVSEALLGLRALEQHHALQGFS